MQFIWVPLIGVTYYNPVYGSLQSRSGHNQVGGGGAKCIAEVLKKHTSLKYLRMGHNHINDGVTCIAQALGKEC